VLVGGLTPSGMYDIHGHTAAGSYRFLMFAFLAGPGSIRDTVGGHHVDEVFEASPKDARLLMAEEWAIAERRSADLPHRVERRSSSPGAVSDQAADRG